jgi:iron(III) transport system permease protein
MTTSNPAAEAALVPSARTPRARGRRKALDVSTVVVVAVVVVLLAILILYPLAAIFTQAFSPEGLKVITTVITSAVNRQIVWNTFVLGVLVGVLGTLLGFLLAYVQVKVAFKNKRLFHILCLLPVVSPPFAVATAIITLLGRRGIITHGLLGLETSIYGLPGLTLVLVLSFFPWPT